MTTLVFRDGILAADSCMTQYSGGKRPEPTGRTFENKITVLSDGPGFRLAIVGKGTELDVFRMEKMVSEFFLDQDWSDDHEATFIDSQFDVFSIGDLEIEDEEEGCGIIVLVKLKNVAHAFHCDDTKMVKRIVPGTFVALGSDSQIAYGALEAGASAVDAVHAACKYGAYTAAPVRYVDAKTMLLNSSHYPSWIRLDQKPPKI